MEEEKCVHCGCKDYIFVECDEYGNTIEGGDVINPNEIEGD